MIDADCREVYQQLVNMLSDRNIFNDRQMDWVVEEVDQVIRAGEIIDAPSESSSRRASTEVTIIREYINIPSESSPRRASREAITTRKYTPQQTLLLLVDAIESVVVHAAFIEREVTKFFQREGEEFNIAPEVTFMEEEENSQQTVFSYASAMDRAEQATHLQTLLNQLRSEVSE